MNVDSTFKILIEKSDLYLNEKDIEQIKAAFNFAKSVHHKQLRKSGEPFILHPTHVAIILAQLEQTKETIISGLLHDTIEDTNTTTKNIQDKFGDEITFLVEGVTKLNKLKFNSKEEQQAENYRRMFLAMAEDIRVIIIKLADRLHNLRTLNFLSLTKQREIAKETLDIYSPLAHRLGIYSIKWELEDLSLFYINNEAYYQIKEYLEQSRKERETYIEEIISLLSSMFKKQHLMVSLSGRPKNIYSIHKKIKNKNIPFHELYDLLGIRIITNSATDCYTALGIVHNHLKPISERFKDYIALPKPNGYQSLHTTVIGPQGRPIEIQIRTSKMHIQAENGISSHWSYKKKQDINKNKQDLKWLNQILKDQKESHSDKDYLELLKFDIYQDEVYVFTPKGEVKELSRGSTALDFAYIIHTEVGHSCRGAIVNGEIKSLNYCLQNGDRVEILRSKLQVPKLAWLKMVTSSQAKQKIKQWLKKQNRETLIHQGKRRVEQAFYIKGLNFKDSLKLINLASLKSHFNCSKIEELYIFIEQGEFSEQEVFRYIYKQLNKQNPEIKHIKRKPARKVTNTNIEVAGDNQTLSTLAKCCSPLPGDDIGGIVVIGKGISIHRLDCINYVNANQSAPERIIDVDWSINSIEKSTYRCTIKIEGYDRKGILQDILNIIYECSINLKEVNTKVFKNDMQMTATVIVDIQNIKQYYELKKKFLTISDVTKVNRVAMGIH